MTNRKKTLLAVAVGVFLAGCGGGSNYVAPVFQPLITTSGKAVDGYLSGSLVVCDTDNNGVANGTEATTTTNSTGDFIFPSGCTATIVVSGGTNIDTQLPFKGLLKAPAGSLVATPLTTLMADGGLSAAQIAVALGLPLGTDVTKLDPVLPANFELQKKTLAIQQVIQQVTDTLSGLAKNASPEALQAIYSAVAKSVVATLVASPSAPLITTSGTVSPVLVSAIIVDSVKQVAASTDTALANSKAVLAVYSGASVAVLVSSAIVAQAQTMVTAIDANALLASAEKLQANTTIASAAVKLETLLTTASISTSIAKLTTTSSNLEIIANPNSRSDDVDAAASAIGNITNIPIDPAGLGQQSNAVSITGIELNGVSSPLSVFSTGVTLTESFQSLGFAYAIKGSPIPANSAGVTTAAVKIGIELTDTINKGQVLQVILDNVNVTLTGTQLSVAIQPGAKMYFYAITSGKTVFADTVDYADTDADKVFSVATGKLTVNANTMLSKLFGSNQTVTANLTGAFNARMVISNLSIAGENATSVQGSSVSVTGTNQSVTGLSVQGKFTLP